MRNIVPRENPGQWIGRDLKGYLKRKDLPKLLGQKLAGDRQKRELQHLSI
jgi:hypothetical protein